MMLHDIAQWQKKLATGAQLGKDFYQQHVDKLPTKIKKIAFVGMGGSGIAGRIIKTLLDKEPGILSTIVDGPDVPGFIDQDTIVFVTTYSGNTWETLDALALLIQKKIPTIVITHGGKAAAIAQEHKIPLINVPESLTPRSALGYFLGIFLSLFDAYGILHGSSILHDLKIHLEKHLTTLTNPSYFDEFLGYAKKRVFFHLWGVSGDSASCVYRVQTQFNENSKIQTISSVFPELCHNLLVGFTQLYENPLVLYFHTEFISGHLKKAMAVTIELLHERGVTLYKPPILGDTFECQLFHIVLWADFASCFLGQVNGVELEPVILIDELKEKHKQKGITI